MELTIAATGALAMITTASTGKEALLQTGEVLLFLELLDWSNLSLERNILSIITNAAENPQMRAMLNVGTSMHHSLAAIISEFYASRRHKLKNAGPRNNGIPHKHTVLRQQYY